MFDWSGQNCDESGKSQGILISCVSGNPTHTCTKRMLYRNNIRDVHTTHIWLTGHGQELG